MLDTDKILTSSKPIDAVDEVGTHSLLHCKQSSTNENLGEGISLFQDTEEAISDIEIEQIFTLPDLSDDVSDEGAIKKIRKILDSEQHPTPQNSDKVVTVEQPAGPKGPFNCPLCSSIYDDTPTLYKHMNENHDLPRTSRAGQLSAGEESNDESSEELVSESQIQTVDSNVKSQAAEEGEVFPGQVVESGQLLQTGEQEVEIQVDYHDDNQAVTGQPGEQHGTQQGMV